MLFGNTSWVNTGQNSGSQSVIQPHLDRVRRPAGPWKTQVWTAQVHLHTGLFQSSQPRVFPVFSHSQLWMGSIVFHLQLPGSPAPQGNCRVQSYIQIFNCEGISAPNSYVVQVSTVHILRPCLRLSKPERLREVPNNLCSSLFQGIHLSTKKEASSSGGVRTEMILEGRESWVRLDKKDLPDSLLVEGSTGKTRKTDWIHTFSNKLSLCLNARPHHVTTLADLLSTDVPASKIYTPQPASQLS